MIWEELSHGLIRTSSRDAVTAMLRELEHQEVEAVILGCTELSLLIREQDTPLPLYDTTQIHAEAILEYALREQATADDEDDPPEPSSPVCYLKEFIHEY
jgi:aspartate racemase